MHRTAQAALVSLSLVGAAGALAGWNSSATVSNSGIATSELVAVNAIETEVEASTQPYEVDTGHTGVLFKIRHGGVSNFYGRFNEFSGKIQFDKQRIESTKINFTVQTGSVDTNSRTRDGHIKGADFFNARQFPEATFASTGVKEVSEGVYTLSGDFTLQGKTVPIEAKMYDVFTGKGRDGDSLGFEVNFTINRSEFGITKYVDADNPEDGPLGDKVELTIAIEAISE